MGRVQSVLVDVSQLDEREQFYGPHNRRPPQPAETRGCGFGFGRVSICPCASKPYLSTDWRTAPDNQAGNHYSTYVFLMVERAGGMGPAKQLLLGSTRQADMQLT